MKLTARLLPGLILLAASFAARSAAEDVGDVPAPEVVPVEELKEIVITAIEPRYVAPTRRDRIGRIWAPVMINGRGPFKLVLDTGSTTSAVMASVSSVMKFSATQDARPLLIHRSSSRVSA